MIIRELTIDTVSHVLPLLDGLWPGQSKEQWVMEVEESLEDKDSTFFLAYLESGKAIGFSQVQLRKDYVEGTETSPVGYLEGLYVKDSERKRGYARALVRAAEAWAEQRGCTEFASDVELHNVESQSMHERLGFTEVNRIVCYVKPLGGV